MQQINQRTPHQVRALQQAREKNRSLLVFTEELVHWQADRGRAVGSESPIRALSWQEPPMQAAFGRPDMSEGVVDMCRYNKRREDLGLLVRKRTLVKGTPEVCRAVEATCKGGHEHSPIQGSMKVKCGKKWKSMRMSTWAGGYTKEFATALIRGAENFLKERWPHGKTNLSYPVEETQVPSEVPEPPVTEEEQFMTPGDEQDGDWSEN